MSFAKSATATPVRSDGPASCRAISRHAAPATSAHPASAIPATSTRLPVRLWRRLGRAGVGEGASREGEDRARSDSRTSAPWRGRSTGRSDSIRSTRPDSARASGTSSAGALFRPAPNGCSPATISKSTTPSANTSVRSSSGAPSRCSGAMYPLVPAASYPLPKTCARPKSSTFTWPSSQRKTFSGLRSLCTTPRPCACATPLAISTATRIASAAGSGPRASRSASVSPRRSSITR